MANTAYNHDKKLLRLVEVQYVQGDLTEMNNQANVKKRHANDRCGQLFYYCCCVELLISMYGNVNASLALLVAECPENCWNCTDTGSSTRCKYDKCKSGYVYKVADGTCHRQ